MIDEKDREIYNLWWEYLKRSVKYREFCNWWKHGGKEPLPDHLRQYHQSMWNTYTQFGDVNNESFEEWWNVEIETQFPSPYHPYYPESDKNMTDYKSVIGKDILKIHRKFKKEQGREPSIKELIHNLELYMTFWEKERLYLLVEFQHASKAELIEEFHDFLSDRMKEPHVTEVLRSIKGMKGISTIRKKPSTVEELERYLRVYDYRNEGLTYSEVAKAMWVITNDDDDYSYDTERIIKRDLRNAKKIIANVENGYFPGQYSYFKTN